MDITYFRVLKLLLIINNLHTLAYTRAIIGHPIIRTERKNESYEETDYPPNSNHPNRIKRMQRTYTTYSIK